MASASRGEKGGHVNGRVKSAARYPADGETLSRILQSDAWADQVMRSGPVLQIVVELKDPVGAGSGSRGPGTPALPELYSGAPCHAHIVVGSMRPISLVLPIFGFLPGPCHG